MTMPRTSAEISALRHKILDPKDIKKQKQCIATLNFCLWHNPPVIQGIARLKYTPTTQIFKQFDMHVQLNIFFTKSHL